jgi:hypothetical protein
MLVGQLVLRLDSSVDFSKETYILHENRYSYFAPMILMPFLGLSYTFGIVFFIINILVIVLLYVYVFILTKRNSLTITKDGISVVYLNNKKDSMLFSDISKVEFNWVYNYIGFLDIENNKLILDITLKDFVLVIDSIKKNVPSTMSNNAFSALSRYYKAFLLQSNIPYLK